VGIEPTQHLLGVFGRLATVCITNLPVFHGTPGRIRTHNWSVKSRLRCHYATEVGGRGVIAGPNLTA
jgi:hypothetical protein